MAEGLIEIIDPGMYTSVQDEGRQKHMHFGVPISGAMDRRSAQLANQILDNDRHCAVLEFTLKGPELRFHNDTLISITGGDFDIEVNGSTRHLNRPIRVAARSVIKIGPARSGVRGYLAVQGGILSEEAVGSRSQFAPITSKSKLEKGDTLPIGINLKEPRFPSDLIIESPTSPYILEAWTGPEFDELDEAQVEKLRNTEWTVGPNNRMAYELKEDIPNNIEPIISSPVLPGTVQLTPSGKALILMRDAQTTGGYPRILQLTPTSIDLLAQKRQGERFQFLVIEP